MSERIIFDVKNYIIIALGLLLSSPAALSAQEATPLTLRQLKDSALVHNIAMRTARLDIAAAREQRREAFTSYFPTISGTAMTFKADKEMAEMEIDPKEFVSPEMSGALQQLAPQLAQVLPMEALASIGDPMTMAMVKDGTIAGVNAVQPVFAGGQIVMGNKLARVGQVVSELKLQLSENEVERQVEQYYWQLVSLREKAHTLDAVDTLLTTLADNAQTAVAAGVALRNDLLQVQLRQNEIASQRLTLRNAQNLLTRLLIQYCGLQATAVVQPESMAGADGTSDAAVRPLTLEMPTADVAVLPEYQLLEKGVEAATLQRKMEVGKRLPSIAVGAGYNYHNILDRDRSFGMIFATASVPITDWWGGAHAIRRRKYEQQKAREQLADNAELLAIRRQKAWDDWQEAVQQLDLAQRSIDQAAENLRVQRDTYEVGTSTMSDLLQAQLLYQQACDQRTEAYVGCQTARLAYRQATGER